MNGPAVDNSSQILSNVNVKWSRNREIGEPLDGLGLEIECNFGWILDLDDEELRPLPTVSTRVNNEPLPIPQVPVRDSKRRNGDDQRATSSIAQPLFATPQVADQEVMSCSCCGVPYYQITLDMMGSYLYQTQYPLETVRERERCPRTSFLGRN